VFENYYKFDKVSIVRPIKKGHLKETIIYRFKSGNYYLVNVEVYSYDIYIIKYFLKRNRDSRLKYNLLTNEGKCIKIISTCVRIMLSIYKKNPKASFGFVGAPTEDPKTGYKEAKEATKRFRVYRATSLRLFGSDSFTHHRDIVNSTYLMISNKNDDVFDIERKSKAMFDELYPILGE
jgi:hypothetical protein